MKKKIVLILLFSVLLIELLVPFTSTNAILVNGGGGGGTGGTTSVYSYQTLSSQDNTWFYYYDSSGLYNGIYGISLDYQINSYWTYTDHTTYISATMDNINIWIGDINLYLGPTSAVDILLEYWLYFNGNLVSQYTPYFEAWHSTTSAQWDGSSSTNVYLSVVNNLGATVSTISSVGWRIVIAAVFYWGMDSHISGTGQSPYNYVTYFDYSFGF